MVGVATPIFVETKMIDMAPTGFLAGIVSQLRKLGERIVSGFFTLPLSMLNLLIGFLDTVASWFGRPLLFSNLWDYALEMFSYIGLAMVQLSTLASSMFDFFAGPITAFISYIGTFISRIIQIFSIMVNIVTGTYDWSVNIFDLLSIPDFVTLFFVFAVPVYLLQVLDTEGIGGVYQKIMMVIEIFAYFIEFFMNIIKFVLDLIFKVIEAIPLIE